MHHLTPIQPGDTIGIISTARKISEAELSPAIQKFENWGLKVSLGKNIFKQFHQFAGTDQQRIEDLQSMLDDTDIKAIVCARGGYGTARIIDQIDFSRFLKTPKWLVGYSDITVLHSHIHNLGVETLHATMPINFPIDGNDNEAIATLYQALFNESIKYRFLADGLNLNFNQKIAAPIIGGNLSILYSLLGSSSDINTKNKILFFEDLDEYLYHIDRMIVNLKRTGKFEHLSAVVIGGLSDMNDNTIPFGATAYEIVLNNLKTASYPIIFNFPAGHQLDNRALILGRSAELIPLENEIIFSQ